MEFSTIEVANVARELLTANPNSGTGHFLRNLAVQAGKNHQAKIKTDNACVIACIKRARISVESAVLYYAE